MSSNIFCPLRTYPPSISSDTVHYFSTDPDTFLGGIVYRDESRTTLTNICVRDSPLSTASSSDLAKLPASPTSVSRKNPCVRMQETATADRTIRARWNETLIITVRKHAMIRGDKNQIDIWENITQNNPTRHKCRTNTRTVRAQGGHFSGAIRVKPLHYCVQLAHGNNPAHENPGHSGQVKIVNLR